MNKLLDFIHATLGLVDRLFNKHRLVRRVIILWALWIITKVIFTALDNWTTMTSTTNAFVAIVVGLLATAIAFYRWSRSNEDSETVKKDEND